jgi:hypothetical protein
MNKANKVANDMHMMIQYSLGRDAQSFIPIWQSHHQAKYHSFCRIHTATPRGSYIMHIRLDNWLVSQGAGCRVAQPYGS